MLNIAHTIDHAYLLIFATAVVAIANDFGIDNWQDLMPYNTGAFIAFGLLSVVAGKLGDHWGRKKMMLVFFFGMGFSLICIALARTPLELAVFLTIMGVFSSIYHPVGIPMLLQGQSKTGRIVGFNGLFGNMGVAIAAVMTGFLIKYFGWKMAFVLPAGFSIILGLVFMRYAVEKESPNKRPGRGENQFSKQFLWRIMLVMVTANVGVSFLFNFTTNSNGQLLGEKFTHISTDPALLGLLLGGIYTIASLSQLIIGRLIDSFAVKKLYLSVVFCQIPFVILANFSDGWLFYLAMIGWMCAIFGAIPFTDAMIGKFIDDRIRSQVAGARLTISFGISSLAVWIIGPSVKLAGFSTMLWVMMAVSLVTLAVIATMPKANG